MQEYVQHTDFGEKIGGAKKDLWRQRGLMSGDLDGMNEREADKYVKKDYIWRKNDYQAMINGGIPLKELFNGGAMCAPVRCEKVDGKSGVKELFARWVEDEGAEGLVVRSELPLVYKIKPRYTIDVAVVGYSEGTGDSKGQIRTLLLAMMTKDGYYQVIGKTGGGFSDEAKVDLLQRLEPLIIDSNFMETDSNHTALSPRANCRKSTCIPAK